MKTLARNSNNDLYLSAQGVAIVTDAEAQRDIITSLILTQQGELQFDEDAGIDYFGTVFQNPRYIELWASEVRARVRELDFVSDIENFQYEFDTKTQSLIWTMTVVNTSDDHLEIKYPRAIVKNDAALKLDWDDITGKPADMDKLIDAGTDMQSGAEMHREKGELEASGTLQQEKNIVNDVLLRPFGITDTDNTDDIRFVLSNVPAGARLVCAAMHIEATSQYRVEYGDGTYEYFNAGEQPTSDHVYDKAGTYTIILSGSITSFSGQAVTRDDVVTPFILVMSGTHRVDCMTSFSAGRDSGLKVLGGHAFEGCTKLSSVNLEAQIIGIGDNCFNGCISLPTLAWMPSTVSSLGVKCFYGCKSLKSLEGVSTSITTIPEECFADCTGLTTIFLHEDVTAIGNGAFASCPMVSEAYLANVDSVGVSAFSGCDSLSKVRIDYDSGVISGIFNSAVKQDVELYVPNGKAVNYYSAMSPSSAVAGGYGVLGNQITIYTGNSKEVFTGTLTPRELGEGETWPPSDPSAGDYYVIEGSSGGNVTFTTEIYNGESWITLDNTSMLVQVIPTVRCWGTLSFSMSDVSSIYGSAGTFISSCPWVVDYGDGKRIRNVSSASTIESYAYGSSADRTITISGYLTKLEATSSANYPILATSTNINNKMTQFIASFDIEYGPDLIEFGNYCFCNCSALTGEGISITCKASSFGSHAFYRCTSLASLAWLQGVGANVASLGEYCFGGCTSLGSESLANIPVSTLPAWCFIGCSGISSIAQLNASVTTLGEGCFSKAGITSLSGLNSTSLTALPSKCFMQCVSDSFTSLDVSDLANIVSIGDSCFEGCTMLVSVLGTSNNTGTRTLGDRVFYGCTSLTNITGFSNLSAVTLLPSYAFGENTSIANLEGLDAITSLAEGCFKGCVAINSLKHLSSVETIGAYCFDGCSALNRIDWLGKNLSFIGDYAFRGCPLTKVVMAAPIPPTTNGSAFYGIDYSSVPVYVFNSALNSYKTNATWKKFSNVRTQGLSFVLKAPSILSTPSFQFTVPSSENVAGTAVIFYDHNADEIKQVETASGYTYTGPRYEISNSEMVLEVLGPIKSIQHPSTSQNVFGRCIISIETVGDSVLELIGAGAFGVYNAINKNLTLTSVHLEFSHEDTSNIIDTGAFGSCENLTDIQLLGGHVELRSEAFRGCLSLETLGKMFNVQEVGDYCFAGCHALQDISGLGTNVISLGNYAFAGCESIESIKMFATVPPEITKNTFAPDTGTNSTNRYTLEVFCPATAKDNIIPNDGDYVTNGTDFCVYDNGEWNLSAEPGSGQDKTEAYKNNYNTAMYWCLFKSSSMSIRFSLANIPYEGIELTSVSGHISAKSPWMVDWGDGSTPEMFMAEESTLPSHVYSGNSTTSDIYVTGIIKEIAGDSDVGLPFISDGDTSTFPYLTAIYSDESVGLETIGDSCFRNCTRLTSVYSTQKGLQTITTIGNYAFYGCTNMEEFPALEGVGTIGAYSFANCVSLTSVHGLASISEITEGAFQGDYRLVNLPEFLVASSIGNDAFHDCASLVKVDGLGNIAAVGDSAFLGCSALMSLPTMPNLITIGANAFAGCVSLLDLDIPQLVETIGTNAFAGCNSVTQLYVQGRVTSIGDGAFSGCPLAVIVSDPWAPPTIVTETFDDSTYESAALYVNDGYEETYANAEGWKNFFNVYSKNQMGVLSVSLNNIPASGVSLETADMKVVTVAAADNLFINWGDGTPIDTVSTLDTNKNLPNHRFTGKASDCTITITGRIKELGNGISSFFGSASQYVTAISTEANNLHLTTINANAFGGCTNLTEIVGFDSVSEIKANAFNSQSPIKAISGFNYALTELRYGMFGNGRALETLEGFKSITTIKASALQGCTNLKTISALDECTTIEAYAFQGCISLAELPDFPVVSEIGNWAFLNCSGLTQISGFADCKRIGTGAFYGCSNITAVTGFGQCLAIMDNAFKACTNLAILMEMPLLRSIGNSAFEGCASLTGTDWIGKVLGSVGTRAFQGAEALQVVKMQALTCRVYDGSNWITIYANNLASIDADTTDSTDLTPSDASDDTVDSDDYSAPTSGLAAGMYFIEGGNTFIYDGLGDWIRIDGFLSRQTSKPTQNLTVGMWYLSAPDLSYSQATEQDPTTDNTWMTDTYDGVPLIVDDEDMLDIYEAEDGWKRFVSRSFANMVLKLADETNTYGFTCDVSLPLTKAGGDIVWDAIVIRNAGLENQTTENAKIKLTHPTSITGDNYVYFGLDFSSNYYQMTNETSYDASTNRYTKVSCYNNGTTSTVEIEFAEIKIAKDPTSTWSVRLANITTNQNDYFPEGIYLYDGNTSTQWTFGTTNWYDLTTAITQSNVFINAKDVLTVLTGITDITAVNKNSIAEIYLYDGQLAKIPSLAGSTSLTKISVARSGQMPDGAPIEIEDSAFEKCENLVLLQGEQGIKSVGDNAFNQCFKLEVTGNFANIESIGDNAFYQTKIRSLQNAIKLTTIGESAFEYCFRLATLGDMTALESIGKQAFYTCNHLVAVGNMPSLTEIQDGAFANTDITELPSLGSLVTIGEGAFAGCRYLQSIGSMEALTNIGGLAFRGCISLTSIDNDLHAVKSIGERAFEACAKLESIRGMTSVEEIGERAFAGCSQLVTLGQMPSLEKLGAYAFSGCTNLDSITETFPNVEEIGDSAFSSTKVTTMPPFMHLKAIGNYVFREFKIAAIDNNNLPAVETIGDYAFANCPIESITGFERLEYIGEGAFADCTSLQSLGEMPSVTTIKNGAFARCTTLTQIPRFDSVTTLEDAFTGCSALTSVEGFNALGLLGGDAPFDGCTSLTSINGFNNLWDPPATMFKGCTSLMYVRGFNGERMGWRSGGKMFDGCPIKELSGFQYLATIGKGMFQDLKQLEKVEGFASVTTIQDSAFRGCSSLNEIPSFASVQQIGENAFRGCSSLTVLPDFSACTSVGKFAFAECSALQQLQTGFMENQGLTFLPEGIFSNCSSLTSVASTCFRHVAEIQGNPENLTAIKRIGAFANCKRLRTFFAFANGINDVIHTLADNMFSGCSSLQSIPMYDNIRVIGEYCFAGCTSLPSSTVYFRYVEQIKEGAFSGCKKLVSLSRAFVDPRRADGVSYAKLGSDPYVVSGFADWGGGVFDGCSSLKAIPKFAVTSLPDKCFRGCAFDKITRAKFFNLKEITDPGCYTFGDNPYLQEAQLDAEVLDLTVFNGCPNLKKLYLSSYPTPCRLVGGTVTGGPFDTDKTTRQNCTIYVDKRLINQYRSMVDWMYIPLTPYVFDNKPDPVQ